MEVKLAYGKTGLTVNLPDDAAITVVEPAYVPGLPDPLASIKDGLRRPIASRPLRELVHAGDRVGIAFSDITRPTPNDLILPAIIEELTSTADLDIVLFNGTGTHRPNTEDELRAMLGDTLVEQFPIIQNDAHDRDSHRLVGTTESGNDVWLHRDFVESDVRVLTGFIEPHLFAGFSGGGKAVMPGLALLDTVMHNHGPQNVESPRARYGIREANPLWEGIREAAAMAEPTFLLNVTLNRNQEVTGVFAGDWREAHAQGCEFVRNSAMVGLEQPFDIVLTSNSGYPLDLNLYQSIKGVSAAAQIVKDKGSIVLVADCWDGIPDHGEYGQLLRDADSVASLLEIVRDPELKRQDAWQAHIQALVSQRADVYVYSHNLTDKQVLNALLLPSGDVEARIRTLLEQHGPGATLCVLPEGPQTIPYIK